MQIVDYSGSEGRDVGLALRGLKRIHDQNGRFHHIQVFDHAHLGRILVMDGEVQNVEAWSIAYHETLVHLAVAFVRSPKNVLVLGGGDLLAAREFAKYGGVRKIVVVEHEKAVVDITRRLFPHGESVLSDPRLEVRYGDAYSGIGKLRDRFDVVVNDGANLLEVGTGKRPFSAMKDRLSGVGVCVDMIYRHALDRPAFQRTLRALSNQKIIFSMVIAPEYPGCLHLLTFWGPGILGKGRIRKPLNLEQMIWRKAPEKNPCRYYDPRYLDYFLYLPKYLREFLRSAQKSA